jgi:hypothetical protein
MSTSASSRELIRLRKSFAILAEIGDDYAQSGKAGSKSQPPIKFPREGPDSRLFLRWSDSFSPSWSARARRDGDGLSSEDTVPDLLPLSTVRAPHRRPSAQHAIAISRRSLHMCTRSGRRCWGL